MDKNYKDKWVQALRSGKYKQTTGQLKYKDTYCCLGVLCDVVRQHFPQEYSWDEDTFVTPTKEAIFLLPQEVVNIVGLPGVDFDLMHEGESTCLSVLNDKYQLSFSHIADSIDAQL